MKVMRFLLGLLIGAGVALLVAPKSGRELRQQLVGGASGRLLGAPASPYPLPEPSEDERRAPEPVAEPPVAVEVEAPHEELPKWREMPPAGEDLRARIERTRAALEDELSQPFAEQVGGRVVETDVAPGGEEPDIAVEEPAADESFPGEQPVGGIMADLSVADTVKEPSAYLVADTEGAQGDAAAPAVEGIEISGTVAGEVLTEAAGAPPVVDEAYEAGTPGPAAEKAEPPVAPAGEAEAGLEPEPVEWPEAEAPRAWDIPFDEAKPAEAAAAIVVPAQPLPAEAPPAGEVPTASARPAAVEEAPVTPEGSAVADEPWHEGGAIDQAEMRRRIEETRARLKAKAFDAMMSGEASLLSRDSGDKQVPRGEDHGLDAETDSAIDESLSQEEF